MKIFRIYWLKYHKMKNIQYYKNYDSIYLIIFGSILLLEIKSVHSWVEWWSLERRQWWSVAVLWVRAEPRGGAFVNVCDRHSFLSSGPFLLILRRILAFFGDNSGIRVWRSILHEGTILEFSRYSCFFRGPFWNSSLAIDSSQGNNSRIFSFMLYPKAQIAS